MSKFIGSTFLYKDRILAIFQSERNTPDRNERFMIGVSGAEMTATESLSRPGGRSSFPTAFLRLSFLSSCITSITDTYPK